MQTLVIRVPRPAHASAARSPRPRRAAANSPPGSTSTSTARRRPTRRRGSHEAHVSTDRLGRLRDSRTVISRSLSFAQAVSTSYGPAKSSSSTPSQSTTDRKSSIARACTSARRLRTALLDRRSSRPLRSARAPARSRRHCGRDLRGCRGQHAAHTAACSAAHEPTVLPTQKLPAKVATMRQGDRRRRRRLRLREAAASRRQALHVQLRLGHVGRDLLAHTRGEEDRPTPAAPGAHPLAARDPQRDRRLRLALRLQRPPDDRYWKPSSPAASTPGPR